MINEKYWNSETKRLVKELGYSKVDAEAKIERRKKEYKSAVFYGMPAIRDYIYE